jgi:D-xylose transport system permease protein
MTFEREKKPSGRNLIKEESISSHANRDIGNFRTLAALVVLFSIFALLTKGNFLSADNMFNLSRQAVMIGIIAVGQTMIIISGGFDLSVGSVVGVVGVIIAFTQSQTGWGLNPLISCLIGLLFAVLIGLWNGVLIAYFRIAPFIVTLGMLSIARGFALVFSRGAAVIPNPIFIKLSTLNLPHVVSWMCLSLAFLVIAFFFVFGLIRKDQRRSFSGLLIGFGILAFTAWIYRSKGIPVVVAIWVALIALGIFIMYRLRIGRNLFAIGGNENAARYSGIRVERSKIFIYMLMSLFAGVSAVILTSRQGAAVPQQGNLYELDSIAAAVIGGTSLKGGQGSILGAMLGVVILVSLENGLTFMNIDPLWQYVVKGLIITIAVLMDIRRQKGVA